MEILFSSIMADGSITAQSFLTATAVSLLVGLFIAFVYMKSSSYSRSFVITLSLLPAVVQLVIMLVNGNIGAGVAVAGAFSLVRFRSAPGSGREITAIFLAMAVGLADGMGYVGVAVIFALVVMAVYAILNVSGFGERGSSERILRITVPETLDFEGIFDDIFAHYTRRAELHDVRTTGMGSLYRLTYRIEMREGNSVKAMIDEIRERNGNLEIVCTRETERHAEEL